MSRFKFDFFDKKSNLFVTFKRFLFCNKKSIFCSRRLFDVQSKEKRKIPETGANPIDKKD
jgi:hypothetical protein